MANDILITYMPSDEILVFPSTRRSDVLRGARYLQELTYANITRHICDNNDGSFVFTWPADNGTEYTYDQNAPFEICIHGYWFTFESITAINDAIDDDTATDIYASIVLDTYSSTDSVTGLTESITELRGYDVTSGSIHLYQGLKLTTSAPNSTYALKILTRSIPEGLSGENIAWGPVEENLYKFNPNNIKVIVDGGIIS